MAFYFSAAGVMRLATADRVALLRNRYSRPSGKFAISKRLPGRAALQVSLGRLASQNLEVCTHGASAARPPRAHSRSSGLESPRSESTPRLFRQNFKR